MPPAPSAPSDRAHAERLLRLQAATCRRRGSPFYGALLTDAADDAARGGPLAALLGDEADDGSRGVVLRLLAAVHRRVLERRLPALALHYPSVGGSARGPVWPVLRRLLDDGLAGELARELDQPLQTNEVGRVAPLLGGLLAAVDASRRAGGPLAVRLVDLGASGGLCLGPDAVAVEVDAASGPLRGGTRVDPAPRRSSHGPAGPGWGSGGLRLPDAWHGLPAGAPTSAAPFLELVGRVGCDLTPVDATTTAGRARLTSYVWPDDVRRLELLRGALAVRARLGDRVRVVEADAAAFAETLRPVAGTLLAVWHSALLASLDDGRRRRLEDALQRLGAAAGPDAPVAHLAFEPDPARAPDDDHLLVLRGWGLGGLRGRPQLLATAPPHGLPVTWR